MKKLMMLLLAMTMVLALAACGMDKPVETAVPTDLPMETETLPEMTDDLMEMETPVVETERSDVAEALDAIRDYDPENLDAAVMRYAAAAKVLTFCKNTERSAAQLKEDVRTYFAGMSDDEKADFSRRYEDVADLASRIAAGDVEQSELDDLRSRSDVDFDPTDPVDAAHDLLKDLDATIRDAVKSELSN